MSYRLPFPKGTKYKEKNPKGIFAHGNFPECKYARDFVVKVGTPVLSIGEGIIVKIKASSNKYLNPIKDPKFKKILKLKDSAKLKRLKEELERFAAKYTNYVLIKHENGTYAEYAHFGKNRIVVKKNQKIKQGELLGYIGYSGIMSEPHLHLNVFKIISIPIKLK